ncbi:hypothetical protein COB64_01405 [Candidatus Wolfebacteria bacterium]|nr:MAG: hypothetical protein COB64_01405 [Candidatus Wolfebacteria bacterium]
MRNFKFSLVAIFLLSKSLVVAQAREDTVSNEHTFMHRYMSLSVGSEKISPFKKGYDTWFYTKISGGIGEQWLIAGLSISFHSETKILSLNRSSYRFSVKEFGGAGIFFRIDGNYLLNVPFSLRYDFAIAYGYHHAYIIEYRHKESHIGIMAEVNIFQNATQPILGLGVSLLLARPEMYK